MSRSIESGRLIGATVFAAATFGAAEVNASPNIDDAALDALNNSQNSHEVTTVFERGNEDFDRFLNRVHKDPNEQSNDNEPTPVVKIATFATPTPEATTNSYISFAEGLEITNQAEVSAEIYNLVRAYTSGEGPDQNFPAETLSQGQLEVIGNSSEYLVVRQNAQAGINPGGSVFIWRRLLDEELDEQGRRGYQLVFYAANQMAETFGGADAEGKITARTQALDQGHIAFDGEFFVDVNLNARFNSQSGEILYTAFNRDLNDQEYTFGTATDANGNEVPAVFSNGATFRLFEENGQNFAIEDESLEFMTNSDDTETILLSNPEMLSSMPETYPVVEGTSVRNVVVDSLALQLIDNEPSILNENGEVVLVWKERFGWVMPQFETSNTRFYLSTKYQTDFANIDKTYSLFPADDPTMYLSDASRFSYLVLDNSVRDSYIDLRGSLENLTISDPLNPEHPKYATEAIDNGIAVLYTILSTSNGDPSDEQIANSRNLIGIESADPVLTNKGTWNPNIPTTVVFVPERESGYFEINDDGSMVLTVPVKPNNAWSFTTTYTYALRVVASQHGIPSIGSEPNDRVQQYRRILQAVIPRINLDGRDVFLPPIGVVAGVPNNSELVRFPIFNNQRYGN